MKSKAQIKKDPAKSTDDKVGQSLKPAYGIVAQTTDQKDDEADDDLSKDEVSNLEEALKTADPGEPVTLKEFKKMAKKWGTK